jgi:hypothetical protein
MSQGVWGGATSCDWAKPRRLGARSRWSVPRFSRRPRPWPGLPRLPGRSRSRLRCHHLRGDLRAIRERRRTPRASDIRRRLGTGPVRFRRRAHRSRPCSDPTSATRTLGSDLRCSDPRRAEVWLPVAAERSTRKRDFVPWLMCRDRRLPRLRERHGAGRHGRGKPHNQAPATLVVACDKVLCDGNGVPKISLLFDLTNTSPLAEETPALPGKRCSR